MPDYDLQIDGRSYNLSWDKPVAPTQADVEGIVAQARQSPAHQQFLHGRAVANQALANAAQGLGLPTAQRGQQTVLAPNVLAQGITPALQTQQQADQKARNNAILDLAMQQAHTLSRPASAGVLPNPGLAAQNAQIIQRSNQITAQKQPLLDAVYPNSPVGAIAGALGAGNEFDSTLAAQTGVYGGVAKIDAGLLNSLPLIAGTAVAPEEISPLLGRLFMGQMATGTAETALDSQLRQSDPGQYWTTLLGNAALTGLTGAHEAGIHPFDALRKAQAAPVETPFSDIGKSLAEPETPATPAQSAPPIRAPKVLPNKLTAATQNLARVLGVDENSGSLLPANSIAPAAPEGTSVPTDVQPGNAAIAAAPPVHGAPSPESPTSVVDQTAATVAEVPTDSLKVDPERFQYKQGAAAGGATGSIPAEVPYNPDLAGTLAVWKDPADGQTYVVNGHNRFAKAQRQGVPTQAVRYIDAPDAAGARHTGALINIAEGQGTALDAAKIFREKGTSPEALSASGVSLKGKMASDGLALSTLDDFLYRQVQSGAIPTEQGVAIGKTGLDAAGQRSLYSIVDKAQRGGRAVSPGDIAQLAHDVRNAPTATTNTDNLFGDEGAVTQNLALEKAQLANHVRERLASDKKLFGGLTKEGKAQELARGGNEINTAENARLAGEAARNVEAFDTARRMNHQGIDQALNEAAIAESIGASKSSVRDQLYQSIQRSLSETDSARTDTLSPGSGSAPAGDVPERNSGTGELFGGTDAGNPAVATAETQPVRAKAAKPVASAAHEVAKPKSGKPISVVIEDHLHTLFDPSIDLYGPQFATKAQAAIRDLKARGVDTSGVEQALQKLPPHADQPGSYMDKAKVDAAAKYRAGKQTVIDAFRQLPTEEGQTPKSRFLAERRVSGDSGKTPTVKANYDALERAETGKPVTFTGFRQNRGSGAIEGTGTFYAIDPMDAANYGDYNNSLEWLANADNGGRTQTLQVDNVALQNPFVLEGGLGGQGRLIPELERQGVDLSPADKKTLTSARRVIDSGTGENGYPVFDRRAAQILQKHGYDGIVYKRAASRVSETEVVRFDKSKATGAEASPVQGHTVVPLADGKTFQLRDPNGRVLQTSDNRATLTKRARTLNAATIGDKPLVENRTSGLRPDEQPRASESPAETRPLAPGSDRGVSTQNSEPRVPATESRLSDVVADGVHGHGQPDAPTQSLSLKTSETEAVQAKLGYDHPLSKRLDEAAGSATGEKFSLDVTPDELKALQQAASQLTPDDLAGSLPALKKRLGALPNPPRMPKNTGKAKAGAVNFGGPAAPGSPSARVSEFKERFVHDVKAVVDPGGVDPAAAKQLRIQRANLGTLAQEVARRNQAMKPLLKVFDRLPENERLSFIDAIETGSAQPNAELQPIADVLRKALDKKRDEVQALGTGALQGFIDDYFPHLWKQGAKSQNAIGQIFGRRSLEGPKSFMKQRSIPTVADGIAAGLEPLTTNPVEMAILKLHEMDRYILGQKIFAESKANGLAKWESGQIPDGWSAVNDKIAKPIEMRPTIKADGTPGAPEKVVHGQYIMPDGAARVLNNYLAPGLHGFAPYDALHYITNAMNSAQLGLSAFHLGTTSFNAMISRVALGGEQLTQGKIGAGLKNVATGLTPYAILDTGLKGNRILQEYLEPGKTGSPDMALAVDAIKQAGGKIGLDPLDQNSAIRQMQQAFREGRIGSGVLRAPFALMELSMEPTMKWAVPRMKLGAYAELAQAELERLGPSATLDAKREALASAWDSIDNRFGQLVYDNLGWNRVTRDLGQIMTRSLGWNLGTVRELGGAVGDTLTTGSRIKNGGTSTTVTTPSGLVTVKKAGPLLTHRQAYAIALPAVVGLYGALYQYAHTGQWPQKLEDYFAPSDGRGNTVNLPSYMKDVRTWTNQAPGKTVTNKLNPALSSLIQMSQNRDYFNKPIMNANHPLVQRAQEEMTFWGKQFLPFTIQETMAGAQRGESKEQRAERFVGITPTHKH